MSLFYEHDWWIVEHLDDLDLPLQPGLVEWRIEAGEESAILRAQETDFRLVETVMEFETPVGPSADLYPGIRPAEEGDISSMLEITYECFVANPAFQNRFKNRLFFTEEQTEEYYRQAVVNHFRSGVAPSVVYQPGSEILAYYMCRQVNEDRYKGVMTGVLEPARGQRIHGKMQQATFNLIGQELWIVNSTQLSNRNTLNSHIQNRRRLTRAEHIFYRLV